MSNEAAWITYLLDKVVGKDPDSCALIEQCGRGCALRRGDLAGMEALRKAAIESGCRTDEEFALYLKNNLPFEVDLIDGGLVMHLQKDGCTCDMAPDVASAVLCNCTVGHEKATWSVYFGKPLKAEIVESWLRGGSDCVVKLIYR